MGRFHKPVLLKEVVDYLSVKPGGRYIDATVGGGGHSEAILKLKGQVLGIDCDPWAIKAARERLSQACPDGHYVVPVSAGNHTEPGNAFWRLARGNFAELGQIARREGFDQVAGILFDLGVSSRQLEDGLRGFSFQADTPLDMRMDPDLKITAADLVNGLNKGELNELFTKLGQEKYSRRIVSALLDARRIKKIETGRELAEIINRTVGRLSRRKVARVHPATRVFQALRIAVNDELNNLRKALPQASELLRENGRLVVISFHSGEDRIVKRFLKENQSDFRILSKKPVRPSAAEIESNPKARSAKLRAAEKK